jgi:hypothetical protein
MAPPVDIIVCDKHGLRYNRAVESGCARCRRESGAVATPGASAPAQGAPRSAQGMSAAEQPASIGKQLLLAAALVAGTGVLFWSAHQSVLESFSGGVLATLGKEGQDAAAAPGQRHSFETTDPIDPANAPTPTVDPRGQGPAEEQKQLHDFLQQMKEDEAKARGAATPAPSEQ